MSENDRDLSGYADMSGRTAMSTLNLDLAHLTASERADVSRSINAVAKRRKEELDQVRLDEAGDTYDVVTAQVEAGHRLQCDEIMSTVAQAAAQDERAAWLAAVATVDGARSWHAGYMLRLESAVESAAHRGDVGWTIARVDGPAYAYRTADARATTYAVVVSSRRGEWSQRGYHAAGVVEVSVDRYGVRHVHAADADIVVTSWGAHDATRYIGPGADRALAVMFERGYLPRLGIAALPGHPAGDGWPPAQSRGQWSLGINPEIDPRPLPMGRDLRVAQDTSPAGDPDWEAEYLDRIMRSA